MRMMYNNIYNVAVFAANNSLKADCLRGGIHTYIHTYIHSLPIREKREGHAPRMFRNDDPLPSPPRAGGR